jgi:hypothetical protein
LIKAGSNEAGENGGAMTMATPQKAVAQQAGVADPKTAENTVRFLPRDLRALWSWLSSANGLPQTALAASLQAL